MTSGDQYTLFKDCLARRIIAHLPPDPADTDADQADALDDFASYLASELWASLPPSLHTISHASPPPTELLDPNADDELGIPPPVSDSLIAYGLAPDTESAHTLILSALRDYVGEATAPPRAWGATRTDACEMCARAVPLTYHHLIPRATHEKALKRRWHDAVVLNSVAWLCRPCHSAVHGVASNEELARRFYTMELLMERDDIRRWAAYAAKQRWGVRRG
ncbi:hypothetical protein K488DRAFT_83672 [Vararia minispora EC-137]|uniref:Uncharacterized protein n=1 Tax=Vararia minispora EC-137 TaxID=1314806 RepID=A0ACB8QSM3_9AGAM|nr:hypothetical protein K488DRAFT_83672 [Vararia minispora EC-137]